MLIVSPDSTNVSIAMGFIDPTTNGPATGLTITDLDFTYCRPGAAVVKNDAVALGGVAVAHVDNGAIELDAVNAEGEYRVDWPDAPFVGGVDMVSLIVQDVLGNQICRKDTILTISPTLAQILAADVDSTGAAGGLPLAKALEVLLAFAMGNARYNEVSREWTVYGRDGTTEVAQILEGADQGDRSESTIL